jgi:hypothetical protein
MPSTYTTNGGIELIATGEQTGTWGSTTNTNLQIVDRLTNGVGAITLSGTTHTLTTSDGSLSDGQYAVLVFGGTPSGTNTVTLSPNDAQHVYIVKNNSGESVVLTQGSGGNVTIADGNSAIVYADGAGSGAAVVDITSGFIPAAALLAANNLSDLANASTARTNLGVEIGVDVEAYDATILRDADIGVSVEAYDATILKDADIGVSVEAYDATILKSADIGVTVQAYSPISAGVITLTASGAITAGKAVAINSDGTASEVVNPFTGSELATLSIDPQNFSGPLAYVGSDTYVFSYYDDTIDSVYVIAGTRGANNTFTLGTAVLVGTTNGTERIYDIAYDSSESKLIIVFADLANSNRISYVTGTLSGTAITLGSVTQIAIKATTYVGVATDNAGTAFIAYTDSIDVFGVAYTIGTDTIGTPVTINADNATDVRAIWDPTESVFCCISVFAENLTVEPLTISGTTITQGTEATLTNFVSNVDNVLSVQLAEASTLRFMSVDTGEARIAQTSVVLDGTNAPVFGNEVLALTTAGLILYAYFDTDALAWFFGVGDLIYKQDVTSGVVTSTPVDYGSISPAQAATYRGTFAYYDSAIGAGVVNITDSVSDNPYAAVIKPKEKTLTSFVGIAKSSVADAADIPIAIIGGIDTNQTGLTVGEIVYVAPTGAVSSTVGDYPIGKALSATSIIIQGDPTV